MTRKNKSGNKQKAKNTPNTGKNSGEKTKIATSTNNTETIVDKKEKQNEIDETENHTSDKVEIATEEQQETKESDKGDCSEMRTPTKQDDKHGSGHKKSKKNKRKSPKKQETSTGKSEAFEPNTSTSSNRQDSAEPLKKSKDTEDKHKDHKRDRNQSGNRQDHNSSKDSISETKQEATDDISWDKNPVYQENHENPKRDTSTSGRRQDHSGSSDDFDFPAKQKHRKDGSSSRDRKSSSHQKHQGSEQDRNRQLNSYEGQSNSGKNYKEGKKQANQQEGREFNQNRDKNPRHERSRSGNRQDPNHSNKKNDYEQNPSRHSQSNKKSNYSEPPEQKKDSWNNSSESKQQPWKSQDHRKSSNDLKPNKKDDVDVGKLFDEYCKEYDKVKGVYKYVRIKETFGDLFECSEEYSLGHCVAEDMGMGAGIAVTFRQKFKQVDELLDQRQRQGGLAVLKDNNRFIYYLVTKQKSNGKPTYETLFKSLVKMRQHIIENDVKKLALPTIGCGLDRLEWDNVKYMLEFLFRDLNMEILIYLYRQDDESTTTTQQTRIRNCKVVHERYTIDKIDSGTLIIYLSSEDGEITEEMFNLDKKFNFLARFKTSPKRLGDTIPFNANAYYLYGCIVKKTKQDLISFKELFKCVSKINRENRKLQFNFVGFQAIDDRNDKFVNDKIINILRNSLSYVDVYICYPENLYYLMPPPKESFSGNY